MRRAVIVLVAIAAGGACTGRPPPRVSRGTSEPIPPAGGPTVERVAGDDGEAFAVEQGAPGAPAQVGCADGQREAFVDAAAFPRIAGCLASWPGAASLRAAATGAACGDDAGTCAVPADACAPTWRVCGAGGRVADLTASVSAEQCAQAGGGRFSAALSHCLSQEHCESWRGPDAVYPCFEAGWCAEAVCCGRDCGELGACRDGIWVGRTHIAQGLDQGCAAVRSQRAGGVLCCRE